VQPQKNNFQPQKYRSFKNKYLQYKQANEFYKDKLQTVKIYNTNQVIQFKDLISKLIL
jgi:hypothetical protein